MTTAYRALPMRVRFGAGSLAELPAELDELGLRRVLVLCTPEQRASGEEVAALLGHRSAGVVAEARMHVPVTVADRVAVRAGELRADGCVAVGGGSAVGLGKALALSRGLPVVAVPTTYAGSEMTPVWGLTDEAGKRTGRDPRVLPVAVVYDPDLTHGLPLDLTVTSAFNAVAHAVEGLWAPDASPPVSALAERGITDLLTALPRLVDDPAAPAARAAALEGAWLCGAVLGATTMSLHHKLCHALGGTLDLPHAATHTVVLPHVVGFLAPAAADAGAVLRRALGPDPARALWELAGELGAPRTLRELGADHDDLHRVADQVVAAPYAAPRPVGREDVLALLDAAWRGDPPTTGGHP